MDRDFPVVSYVTLTGNGNVYTYLKYIGVGLVDYQ